MRPVNKLIVDIQEFRIETESGLILYPDTNYKPELADSIYGVVVSRPPVLNNAGAQRFYLRKGEVTQYKFSDFPDEFQVGDKVWFNYQASRQEQWMWEDNKYWILYDHVMWYERGEELFAAPGKVLVKPIKKTAKFLAFETTEGEYSERGQVIKIGTPLKGQCPTPYEVGDVVVFDPRFVDKTTYYKAQNIWAVDFDEILVVLPDHAKAGDAVL